MDNYAEFLARLNAASGSLRGRRESLATTLELLTGLFNLNHTGLQLWEQRLRTVTHLVDRHAGEPARKATLVELQEIASKMEPMFRTRTERIEARRSAIRERCAEIDRALRELEKSRLKLNSSRMLAQERENLSRAVTDLAGTPEGPVAAISDSGLREDLQGARRAIILAEALLEVKGNQPWRS